jgi:hypothetical protein
VVAYLLTQSLPEARPTHLFRNYPTQGFKKRDKMERRVLAVVGGGFVALWRGHQVRSVGGAIYYFRTEWDPWMFLWLCDAVSGVPAIAAGTPAP